MGIGCHTESYKKIDVNRSRLIDFSEFMAAISRVDMLFAKQRLQKAFDFIDNDGAGEIKISELAQLLNSEMENEYKDEEDEEIEGILKEFDYDGDKTISKQEFIIFFLKLKEAQRMKDEEKMEFDRKV